MTHHGIPTKYKGTQFRSRVEATWAAFFDLLGWPWEYEPIDLAGYIPDFVLRLPHAPVLVEVKYEVAFELLEQYVGKIEQSGWKWEALLVGAFPFSYLADVPSLGLHGEVMEDEGRCWDHGAMMMCRKCGRPSFYNVTQSFRCRVSGCYDGDHYLGEMAGVPEMWAQAKNTVQWRPPRAN